MPSLSEGKITIVGAEAHHTSLWEGSGGVGHQPQPEELCQWARHQCLFLTRTHKVQQGPRLVVTAAYGGDGAALQPESHSVRELEVGDGQPDFFPLLPNGIIK